ncbi:hypothetical protein BKA70DRAFT_1577496 [Coprinopsis sp. MPI-PUGE-AT-0042]|nr:hypothetical protein BKA70DRAFT_1577496 [Coprinopsis sp. MPI-PUGE-AT-0042]
MVNSVRRCPTSSTDKPVGGEASANLDGFAKKEWDKIPPRSNARFVCQPHLPCLSTNIKYADLCDQSSPNGHPSPCFICLIKRPAPPNPQAITLRDSIVRLHFIDRIKTLDLFATRHLCCGSLIRSRALQPLSTPPSIFADDIVMALEALLDQDTEKELLAIGLGQRLC